MTEPAPRRESASLRLANGTRWGIAGTGECEAALVSRLRHAMRIEAASGVVHGHMDVVCGSSVWGVSRSHHDDSTVVVPVFPREQRAGALSLAYVSTAWAGQVEASGGTLLHGALAEWDGAGVILAGRSGVGKTTASRRLPAPWRSLSDDKTLVVGDGRGRFFAHPWPTWSRFEGNGAGDRWDVQRAVPLLGVFFLDQAETDGIRAVGPGEAVCLLTQVAEQAQRLMAGRAVGAKARSIQLRRFGNICELAKAVPGYVLRQSLTGAFWEEIHAVLAGMLAQSNPSAA